MVRTWSSPSTTMSSPIPPIREESRGLAVNGWFWQAVDAVVLTSDSVGGAYAQLAERLSLESELLPIRNAMRTWAELFDGAAA
jgi:hypothetical protein